MPGELQPYANSQEHLFDELRRLDLLLGRAVVIARHHRASGPGDTADRSELAEETVTEILGSVDLVSEHWRRDENLGPRVETFDTGIETARKAIDEKLAATEAAGRRLTLPRLAGLCGLIAAEVDLLLIALAPELEPRYEVLYSYLQDNDPARRRPSVDLSLNLTCRAKEEKVVARRLFAEGSALLYFQILELHDEPADRNPTLLRKFTKVNETVVRFLLEQSPTALAAGRLVIPQQNPEELEVSARTRAELQNLADALERIGADHTLVHMVGSDPASVDDAARALGRALNRPLLWVTLDRLETGDDKLAALVRDAALWNAAVVIRRPWERGENPADAARLARLEEDLWSRLGDSSVPVIVLAPEDDPGPMPPRARLWRLSIEPPDYAMRKEIWTEAMSGALSAEDAARLADLFPYPAARVRQIGSLAWSFAALRNPSEPVPNVDDVLHAGRSSLAPNLRRFATAREPRFGWNDIVLPEDKMRQLRAVASRVERRHIVQRDWAFGEKLSRGVGVSVLFAGPSGTGKTMAAEVLARELHLDLIRIDLSAVVSKYIGETEKNLNVIFREARFTQVLLFFDEADALFGKRTEVKDAHDRYANIEVSYLLQRMEQYEGIVILATNFQKNLDDAFVRRLADIIEFPFPDERLRERIWRQHFPEEAPLDPAINFPLLAQQFKLTGGKIRNAALSAAYLAAQEGGEEGRISMEHIVAAVKAEFQKEGKLVMKGDLGPYSNLVGEVRR